jgi:hypothetical protein
MAWLQGAAGLPMCQYRLVDDSGLLLAVLPGLIDRVPWSSEIPIRSSVQEVGDRVT